MKKAQKQLSRRKTSELTTTTSNTYRNSVIEKESVDRLNDEFLIKEIDKLRKQNDILLDWNRQAERKHTINKGQKLEFKQLHEQQMLVINQLSERLHQKESIKFDGEKACNKCNVLQKELKTKELLIDQCKIELQNIKKQMTQFSMIRSKENNEQLQLKSKIINKLEKQLLDSRIEVLRFKERLMELESVRTMIKPLSSALPQPQRQSGIRKSMQKNNKDQLPGAK